MGPPATVEVLRPLNAEDRRAAQALARPVWRGPSGAKTYAEAIRAGLSPTPVPHLRAFCLGPSLSTEDRVKVRHTLRQESRTRVTLYYTDRREEGMATLRQVRVRSIVSVPLSSPKESVEFRWVRTEVRSGLPVAGAPVSRYELPGAGA
jgi:hypothetical protein